MPFLIVVLDLLAALFSQLNVNDNSTVALTSALREIVQNAVIAALQEVAAATTRAPALVRPSAATIPASSTTAPLVAAAATPANAAATATTLLTRTHHGVTYYIPHPSACGPFYWVNRGRHIGVFATW